MRDKAAKLEIIVSAIAEGLSIGNACRKAGIGRTTLHRWMKDATIEARVRKAEADFEAFHLSRISAAGATDWKASAWILERKYPRRYGRRTLTIEPKPKPDDDGDFGILVRVPTVKQAERMARNKARKSTKSE